MPNHVMNEQVAYERLVVERRGAKGELAWISLSNPGMRNALDEKMQVELIDLLGRLSDDISVGCVVIRGEGSNFCSGGDIRGFDGMTPAKGEWYCTHRGEVIQTLLARMGKPVLAAVDGWCLAGGSELALMCDFVYATNTAKFGLTEINIGLLPGWGGLTRLPRAIGIRRAREMIYRGRTFGADLAQNLGLVNELFETADAMYSAIETVAVEIASKSRAAVRVARGVIADTQGVSDQVAMALERGAVVYLLSTPDVHDGVSAFREKRTPIFNKHI